MGGWRKLHCEEHASRKREMRKLRKIFVGITEKTTKEF
jgi:hypothetical protein